jgi:hypothetical protein
VQLFQGIRPDRHHEQQIGERKREDPEDLTAEEEQHDACQRHDEGKALNADEGAECADGQTDGSENRQRYCGGVVRR